MPEEDVSRRDFLAGAGALGAAVVMPGAAEALGAPRAPRRGRKVPHPKTPTAALRALQAGNKRYRAGKLELRNYSPLGERRAEGQKPFAAIITCADSRLSPTLMFDVERGNLFVSRVAGNSIDTGTLGSTEYAVAVLGVKLIMVLGHTDCGAVKAAIDVANGAKSYPASKYGSIGTVVDEIVPTVRSVPPDQRNLRTCTAANASSQAADIASRGPIIKAAIGAGTLRVVAAVYEIKNGRVRLL